MALSIEDSGSHGGFSPKILAPGPMRIIDFAYYATVACESIPGGTDLSRIRRYITLPDGRQAVEGFAFSSEDGRRLVLYSDPSGINELTTISIGPEGIPVRLRTFDRHDLSYTPPLVSLPPEVTVIPQE